MNDYDSSAGGDQAHLAPAANPFSSAYPHGSGMFPRLAPRKFPDDEDTPPHQVPVMEQLPTPRAGFPPPPAYGPPPSYGRLPAERNPTDYSVTHPYQGMTSRAAGMAPPVLPSPGRPTRYLEGAPLSAPVAGLDMPASSPVVAETSELLTAEWLLHGRRAQPGQGWRRTVYRATGGLVRVSESASNLRRRDLVNRVRTPVAGGHHRVAVMSLKGGVGKTTTAVGLGATLASLRGDRVIAMDANPDRGTLSDKVRLETTTTVRDLLNDRDLIRRYADVRQFTSQASSRLEILASDRDPGVSIAFSADDYREVSRVLEHYYSIAITDCGTGLLHSAMSGILELADHIVLVSSPSVDGARSASATLDWLEAHHYTDLVRSAVVVLSTIRSRSRSTVDLDRLEAHFASRCRDVVRIPHDAHLEEGAEVELDLMSSSTRDAYLTLAATVGDGLAVPRRSRAHSAT
jgi:MinD-like ATPase involved in chromosome partitioning or flagellar assembly